MSTAERQSLIRRVTIDGGRANLKKNMLYKGNGMVSANNSSRLLIDYKQQHPEIYARLLRYLFGSEGLGINHLKLEMGADIDSSSGTEPCVKRTEDEKADVTRGAGYILAHDAKEVNPDLTLDMLWWSEPLWVTQDADVYAARYKWYKETLDAAYEKYGLKFDYVSATRNERAADNGWIKYLSKALKSESCCPYDYSGIKIVAGEEVGTWYAAEDMLADKELLDAVDVIGSHYTSRSTESVKKLAEEYGKEVWFSEASSPMEYAQGAFRYDRFKNGISEINGMLDIAARFLTMYPGGDGHAIVDAVYTYMTAADTKTGDHSVTVVNTTGEPIEYQFTVKALAKAGCPLSVWETRGPDGDRYDENYFKKTGTVTPALAGGEYTFSLTVKPCSLVTLTTLDVPEREYVSGPESAVLELPYRDNFDYDENFLSERGGAPLYTTDQGGAFEVTEKEGRRVLMQKITPQTKANDWGGWSQPCTCLGDDRWWNCSVSADVYFEGSAAPEENFAGIALRYDLADRVSSGYDLALFESGKWQLRLNGRLLREGSIGGISAGGNALRTEALYDSISCYINGECVCKYTHPEGESIGAAGRAGLFSSYDRNSFGRLEIEPLGSEPYITRYNNTHPAFEYSGSWEHRCMSSFKNYKRTEAAGTAGCSLTFRFSGSGFLLTGSDPGRSAKLAVSIDGGAPQTVMTAPSEAREAFMMIHGLEAGQHTAVIELLEGKLAIDTAETF